MSEAPYCWCLACDPKTGEIGLECKLPKKPLSVQEFMEKQFANPETKAVYERLAKR